MIRRTALDYLQKLSGSFPVIGIIGPRQTGKTTLALEFRKHIKKDSVYLDLEKPSDLEKLTSAEIYLSKLTDKCVIIDEVQVKPELFSLIRATVDENRKPLRFILLGSANPSIIKGVSESLAGRIAYLELGPFNLFEAKNISLEQQLTRGGFPDSLLAGDDEQSRIWRQQFIQSFIERDLAQFGFGGSPVIMRKLWEMLAWQNGGLVNLSSLAKSLGVNYHLVDKYIQFLEGAFMVKQVQPYHFNIKKRLVKAPKIYIRDTGILCSLLRIKNYEELSGSPFLGAAWEGFVFNQIYDLKRKDMDINFYRTHAGAEADLVLLDGLKPVAAIEIKYTKSPNISRGNIESKKDLKAKKNYVIIPEGESYEAKDNFYVCNIKDFLEKQLPKL